MISKITKGTNMHALVRYLTGPGNANEHTNPHLVASSGTLAAEFTGTDWSAQANGELSMLVDGDWRRVRRERGLPLSAQNDDKVVGAANGRHVFHVSLSLNPGEGKLSEETWAAIAKDYVDAMEFDGPVTEASGRTGCQWIAVHHGATKNGGDHLHIAVSLVRANGTRASVHRDWAQSRKAVDAIEARYGLRPVKDRAAERGFPGYTQAEASRAAAAGAPEVAGAQIARRLRAAAAVSTSEAEFVRSVRQAGLLVRPFYAAQSTDLVRGYSVAVPPAAGERPSWRAPSKIDKTLGLGQLRARWGAATDGSDGAGQEALSVWRAPVKDATPATAKWSQMRALPPETATQLSALTARLAKVDQVDRVGWQTAAREASFVFARWSLQTEGERPGPLAAASDALARSAQPDKDQRGAHPRPDLLARNVALMARATSKNTGAGWLAVMSQLDRVTSAVQDAHAARGELVAVGRLRARTGMDLVGTRMALVEAEQMATWQPEGAVSAASADVAAPTPEPARAPDDSAEQPSSAAQDAQRVVRPTFPESAAQSVARGPGRTGPPAGPAIKPGAPRRERTREEHEL